MAIAYDAVTTLATTGTMSLSHSASGSDRMAVIFVAGVRNNNTAYTFDDVTYDGVSASFKAGVGMAASAGRYMRIEVWTIGNIPTGSKTVAATYSGATLLSKSIACITFTGVTAAGDADAASGVSTAPTVNLTTTENNAVVVGGVSAFEQSAGGTIGSGTERWDFESPGDFTSDDHWALGGHQDAVTAGSHDFSYTINDSDDWGVVAVELQPSAGSTGRAKIRALRQGTRFGVHSGM